MFQGGELALQADWIDSISIFSTIYLVHSKMFLTFQEKIMNMPQLTPLTLKKKLLNILLIVIIGSAYLHFVDFFINFINPPDPTIPIATDEGPQPTIAYMLFITCIFAPIWEELIFRKSFIMIARKLGKGWLTPIVYLSSFIFGWLHGRGQQSIMIQGVAGLLFSYVYVKNGDSYWSSVLAHSMWNFLIFIGL